MIVVACIFIDETKVSIRGCRDIKTKVISLGNHNKHILDNKPNKLNANMQYVPTGGKREQQRNKWFWF